MSLGFNQERKYTSVTLLYQYNKLIDASSGIYILDNKGKNYIISIISEKFEDINNNKLDIKYTCGELINDDKVKWINIPISNKNFLIQEIKSKDLEDFFNNCNYKQNLRKKYLILIELPQFCVIRNELKFFKIYNNYKNINIVPKSIKTESSPFGLSTVDIFNGYINFGHINYESKNKEFWLSDTKFMDNMNGGIVMLNKETNENECIGLIWGNIKWERHGELMIIINWNVLLNNIKLFNEKNESDIININQSSLDLINQPYKKIVGIKICDKYDIISWGSGIIIDNGLIVSNKHVITGNLMNNEMPKYVEIKFNNGFDEMKKITIFKPKINKDIFMSIENNKNEHDICFITFQNERENHEILQIPGIRIVGGELIKSYGNMIYGVNKGLNIKIGESSISIGYGLFYDFTDSLNNTNDKDNNYYNNYGSNNKLISIDDKPLQSVGNINKITGNYETIISSGSCWSGCSGGAVVNKFGELIGVMVNNIKHVESGEVFERINFAIGIPIISACYRKLVVPQQDNRDTQEILNNKIKIIRARARL